MRILILSLYYAPDVAANAAIMSDLAEALAAGGHRVTVITSFPHYATNTIEPAYRGRLIQREERGGVRVIRTYLFTSARKEALLGRMLSYASFTFLSTLAGLFSGSHDVILAPSPPLIIGLAAYVVSRFKRIPYIYSVQDIYPDVAITLGVLRTPWIIRLSRRVERFVYDHAGCVTVLSDGFRENLLGKGVSPDRVRVVPNFVETEFIRPLPRENGFRQRLGLNGRFVVLYAGNLGLSQGLEHVLESARLLQRHEEIAFVIVGNGSQKASLEDRARRMGLRNLRFVPFQPRQDVPEIYAAADVSLVTLRRGLARHSMPSKVYAIMASARPVIATVDPGSDIAAMIERARCGLCVEPEDAQVLAEAILTLHADSTLRERLGHSGREYVVANHSRRVVAHQYVELLSSLAEQTRPRPRAIW